MELISHDGIGVKRAMTFDSCRRRESGKGKKVRGCGFFCSPKSLLVRSAPKRPDMFYAFSPLILKPAFAPPMLTVCPPSLLLPPGFSFSTHFLKVPELSLEPYVWITSLFFLFSLREVVIVEWDCQGTHTPPGDSRALGNFAIWWGSKLALEDSRDLIGWLAS